MDNTLPMARSKRKRGRPSVLLVGSRPRLSQGPPSSRNKRKKTASTNKKAKGRAVEDITTESSPGAEVEAPHADAAGRPKSKRHRRHDKGRKPDRGVEGNDRTPRRSASELGIEWITALCPDGQPHYLIANHTFDGGSLFKCSRCLKHIWLPTMLGGATELEQLIKHLGTQRAYCKFLDKHREAKVMVAKLQDLWYARQEIGDDGKFADLVIKIMEDKEYDRMG